MNRGVNKRPPSYRTREERAWYEGTPKRAIAEIVRDFAIRIVGEDAPPDAWLKEVQHTEEILRNYGYI